MRKKLIGLFLFACLGGLLTIPAIGLGQQRGVDLTQQESKGARKAKGSQGDIMPAQAGAKGGNGQLKMGGMNLDVNAVFDHLANGQDSVLVSSAGQLGNPLQHWARDNGNTSGSVSRQQFYGFMLAYVPALQKGKAGAAKGQGAKDKGAKGGDPDAAIAQRFKGVDKNGDGFISNDEMSANARETGVWKKFDVDGDTRLNLEEYKVFSREKAAAEQALKMAGGAQGTAGLYTAMVESTAKNVVTRVEKIDWDKRPVVFGVGKLPPGMPKWFVDYDTDRDAQIGLYEWNKSAEPLQNFFAMDRNDDRLVTADEVLWHMKRLASMDNQSLTIASFSQSIQNVQGIQQVIQNGGFAGFNTKGKGGGKKGDFGGGFGGGGGTGSKKGKKGGGEY